MGSGVGVSGVAEVHANAVTAVKAAATFMATIRKRVPRFADNLVII